MMKCDMILVSKLKIFIKYLQEQECKLGKVHLQRVSEMVMTKSHAFPSKCYEYAGRDNYEDLERTFLRSLLKFCHLSRTKEHKELKAMPSQGTRSKRN